MSSDEKIDGVTLTQPVNVKKSRSVSWIAAGVFCALMAVTVLILAGGYSGWYLMTANMQLAKLATQSQNQLQQLQSDLNTLKTETSVTQQTVQQFSDDIKNLKQAVSDVSHDTQGNQEKWLLTESRYYAKLANDNLQFSRNVPVAIVLLKMADQEISSIKNPKIIEIRKAIAADIANLQVAPSLDVGNLYLKLATLNYQVDQLPLLSMRTNSQAQKPVTTTEQNQTGWRRGLHAAWLALQGIVVVRYNTSGVVPLMTPAQQGFLYQSLHAMFDQSIWALLHQRPEIYQASLQQMILWIKRYFVLDAPSTLAMLNDLTQLEKINIYPPALTMTNTLQAFNGA